MGFRSQICPLDLAEFESSRGTFHDAVGLPPSVYFSEDFYRFEADAIFGQEWL